MIKSEQGVKTYFVTIPAHRYLHLRNYESNGYWDFWEKQSTVPGGDCATAGCELDTATPGRLTYFYFEPGQYFKYIRPIRRK